LSTAFADPNRQQKTPAYVLSPQTPQGAYGGADGVGWWHPNWQQAVVELVDHVIETHPNINTDRIYLTGVSMGSYGSWEILVHQPNRFAAALLVCGAGDEDQAVQNLTHLPIWAVHSIDDATVAYDDPGSDFRIFQAFEAAGVPVVWSQWRANDSR